MFVLNIIQAEDLKEEAIRSVSNGQDREVIVMWETLMVISCEVQRK